MSATPVSGTLGEVQFMAFASASSGDALRDGAAMLGFTKTVIQNGTVREATEYLRAHASPEILLIEVTSAEDAPLQLDALAEVVNPHTKVLVCGPLDSYRFYHWLMDLGIHEYVLQPFTAVQLKQAIVKGAAKKQEAGVGTTPQAKKLVAVMGARGGVGTTTIASNLGALLAREQHLATAIIDLDPYFGSVALAFDLEAGRGLRDALEKPDRVDSLFLERVMVKPFAPLSILSAEEPLGEVMVPQGNAGDMLFAAVREKFGMVVVDVPRQMNALSRYVLANADAVVVVADPQLMALRDSLRIKDYLVDTLKRPAPHLLLNRVGMAAKHELSLKEFSKHYGGEVALHLPYLPDAIAASAEGALLVNTPKTLAALAPLQALAVTLSGVEAVEDETELRGFARFLKGMK